MKRKMLLVGIGALLIATLFSISIVSCEREVVTTTVGSNISNDNVVGTWKYYKERGNGYYDRVELVFKSDYTGTYIRNSNEEGSGEWHESWTFRYMMTSNVSGYAVKERSGKEDSYEFFLLDGEIFFRGMSFTKE